MTTKLKVIVAHPAQQHSFRTALAIKSNGNLYKYVTSVYTKNLSFSKLLLSLLKGTFKKKLGSHYCSDLDDSEVKLFMEPASLFLLFLRRIDKKKIFVERLNEYITNKFNIKLAKYIVKHKIDVVILYDTLSLKCMKILTRKKSSVKIILDMSAPYLPYMSEIFRNDFLSNNGKVSSELIDEINSDVFIRRIETSKKEILLANHFLAASDFTIKSLTSFKVPQSKISKCVYGKNCQIIKTPRELNENKIHCIFVGNVTPKKGIHYFLRAVEKLYSTKSYLFTAIGDFKSDSEYVEEYSKFCTFTGHITKDRLHKFYESSDIMVFPSLADGFGFVVLEALSFGIPVICSTNAGASDIIKDGYNGFIIPPGDAEAIAEKVEWFEDNRAELKEMSNNSRKSVESINWTNYTKELSKVIEAL